MIENREIAAGALAALVQEPISHTERQRLRQLLEALQADTQPGSQSQTTGLANHLASPDFAWLPLQAEPQMQREGAPERVATSASGFLMAVADAILPIRPHPHGFAFGLIYPLILLAFAWIVLAGLSIMVVPTFSTLFTSFGLDLPLPTRLLIGLSHLLTGGGRLWVCLFLIVAVAVWLAMRQRVRREDLSFAARLRQRGNASELLAMSRFCRGLTEASAAGAPVPDALRWAGSRCGHTRFATAAEWLADRAAQGDPLIGASAAAQLFPANLLQALFEDREAGQTLNCQLLQTLAEIYEERAAERSESGATLLGIFAVAGVIGSVGFAALSLFMPLIQLITGLS